MGRPQRGRKGSYMASLLFLGAVAYPCSWPYPRDSFPLSSFPMFARPRPVRASIPTVVGVTAGGRRTTLSPTLIADSRWVNLSARLVRKAVVGGRRACTALCGEIALRVRAARVPEVVALEVVTETFDSLDYFAGDPTPLERRVHATCGVTQ